MATNEPAHTEPPEAQAGTPSAPLHNTPHHAAGPDTHPRDATQRLSLDPTKADEATPASPIPYKSPSEHTKRTPSTPTNDDVNRDLSSPSTPATDKGGSDGAKVTAADAQLTRLRRAAAFSRGDRWTLGSSRVWNRFEWALRSGMASGFGAVVVLTAVLADEIPLTVLVPIIACLGAQQSIGATLAFASVALKATLAVAVPISLIALAFEERSAAVFWVAAFFVLVCTHVLSTQVGAKKLTLAFGSVNLWLWWQAEATFDDWHFPFSMFKTVGAGCFCALLAVVLPFPRTGWAFARRRRENAHTLTARIFAEFTAAVVNTRGSDAAGVDGVVHLGLLDELIPALQAMSAAAEYETLLLRGATSFFASITIIPGCLCQLDVCKELRVLQHDVAVLQSIATALHSLKGQVSNISTMRLKSPTLHERQMVFLKVPLIELCVEIADFLHKTDGSAISTEQTERLQTALNSLVAAMTACRTQLLYTDKVPLSPDTFIRLKTFIFYVKQFSELLITSHTESVRLNGETAEFTPFKDVFLTPWVYCLTEGKGIGLKAWSIISGEKSGLRDLLESTKTVCALLGSLGASIGLDLTPSFWAPITVGFISAPNAGGSFGAAMNRLQGTVFGSTFGYIVVRTVTTGGWELGACFTAWSVLSGYVKAGDPKYSYTGAVASLTAAIVLFGYNPETGGSHLGHESLDELAFSRIQQTLLAAVIYMVCVYAVSPIRPSQLIRAGLKDSLGLLQEVLRSMVSTYVGENRYADQEKVVGEAGRYAAGVRAQRALLPESEDEIMLWRAPFHAEAFKAVLADEAELANFLTAMVHSWVAMKEHSGSLDALQTSLDPLLEELLVCVSELLHDMSILAEVGGSGVCADAVSRSLARTSGAASAVASRFYANANEHTRILDAPVISNDAAEALYIFLQSFHSISAQLAPLNTHLRALRVKEQTWALGIV